MLEPIDFAQLYVQQSEAQGTAQPNTPRRPRLIRTDR
jgi:preprotein translocase subunit SecB